MKKVMVWTILVLAMLNAIVLFTGCSESSNDKTSSDRYQTNITLTLKVVCVEGLEAYRGYSGYPAMYKRDINDKLIPCDNNKFNN